MNRQLLHSKKFLWPRICEAFNQGIKADFVFIDFRGLKLCMMIIIDTGTNYSKTEIFSKCSCDVMVFTLKAVWTLRHGDSRKFSADSEFVKGYIIRILASYEIEHDGGPVRRHKKRAFLRESSAR